MVCPPPNNYDSGALKLHDLSLSLQSVYCKHFLIAPNQREKEIKAQFKI